MFYRHLHAPECILSVHGDEAPQTVKLDEVLQENREWCDMREKYVSEEIVRRVTSYATLEAECRWAMEWVAENAYDIDEYGKDLPVSLADKQRAQAWLDAHKEG